MKLYKLTNNQIAIEQDHQYRIFDASFDEIVNADNLADTLSQLWPSGVDIDLTNHTILAPIGSQQELWACGVTYLRSKVGRQEESKEAGGGDFYEKVYHADRPEIFFKATPSRVVRPKAQVRIRKDSTWDVPDAELALVVNSKGNIIGYTTGNDMSSRSIEGENPLYLPQAKTYDACAALGPCISVINPFSQADTTIQLTISRAGQTVFNDTILLSQMKRTPEELVKYVCMECSFPHGCIVMTGTGIVPPNTFTLQSGDVIKIGIIGIGELENEVG
ncbi:MAG TPA: fumarylacetoacetate hydrolase family protein [Saprospiraceae bacterium]|nr:fumarylacetoacetate hydrolase family protein [Saprospiraceae bacterium]